MNHSIKLSDKGLARLVGNVTKDQMRRLVVAIKAAVRQSLQDHPLAVSASMKEREVQERIQFCVDMALELHRDQHWTVERICDHLHLALDRKLSSVIWTPSNRAWW